MGPIQPFLRISGRWPEIDILPGRQPRNVGATCQKNVRNPNHHFFSKKYRTTPPICIAVRLQFVLEYFRRPYALRKGKYCQYSSHFYRSTPPICIAVRLPFVSQYFLENLGGCGHRDVGATYQKAEKGRCGLGLRLSGPFGLKCPRPSVFESVPENGLCPAAFRPRALECPTIVPRVSMECQKDVPHTPGTSRDTCFDTPEPGAGRGAETPIEYARFQGRSPEHFAPDPPERLL